MELKPGDIVKIKDEIDLRYKMIFKGIINGEAVCYQVFPVKYFPQLIQKIEGEVSKEVMNQLDEFIDIDNS